MNDTHITFHGWAGGDVRLREAHGVPVASLRVAVTPRLRRHGEWSDGETTWYSVTAWRGLAENLSHSVRKGDPVVVHGRLRTETYIPAEGTPSVTLHVDASLIGHDLSRGTTHFSRSRPQAVDDAQADPQADAQADSQADAQSDARGGALDASPVGGTEADEHRTAELEESLGRLAG